MKTHRLARKQHIRQLYAIKRAILLDQMRKVADAFMGEHWAFWQQHHIGQEDIERTLVYQAMDPVERENELGRRLSWEDLHMIAREIYEKYA